MSGLCEALSVERSGQRNSWAELGAFLRLIDVLVIKSSHRPLWILFGSNEIVVNPFPVRQPSFDRNKGSIFPIELYCNKFDGKISLHHVRVVWRNSKIILCFLATDSILRT